MLQEKLLRKELQELKTHELLQCEIVSIEKDAPKALLQLVLVTQVNTIEKILQIPYSEFPLSQELAAVSQKQINH